VLMSKAWFLVLNYCIIGAFVLVNLYISYEIVRRYGVLLGALFRGQK